MEGEHVMKKILVVLLSLTLIFAFTGCTSSNNGAAEDIEIKTQEVVTSNTDDDDDNISNTENAVENVNEKDYDFSSYENDIRNITKSVNNAKRSTNASENHEQFYALKKQKHQYDNTDYDKVFAPFETLFSFFHHPSFFLHLPKWDVIQKYNIPFSFHPLHESFSTISHPPSRSIDLNRRLNLN